MESIRIGNDLEVNWSINIEDGGVLVPYRLEGRRISFYVSSAYGKVQVRDYSVRDNVLTWKFPGKYQRHACVYSFELVENEGEDGMYSVDECDAFRLVGHSCEVRDDEPEEDVEVVSLQLKTVVAFPGGGGSIPEGVDSTLIRILYTADESTGETLTEEQKAYNAETYRMFAEGLTPIVALDGHVGSGIWYEDEELGEAVDLLFKGDLGSAMTIVGCCLREDGSAEAVVNIFTERLLNLTDQFSAQIFFEYYGFLFELKGVMPTSEYGISEVDVVGYNGRHYVEYNEHDKRFRVEFNADYTIKERIDITPAGGGGSIDPELVEEGISSVAASIVQEIVDNECVMAAALNDLNDRIKELEERLKNAGL